jgi:hypothetical protein
MNHNTESAECLHGMCSACRYDDCACECHGPDEDEFYDADENTTIEKSGYA